MCHIIIGITLTAGTGFLKIASERIFIIRKFFGKEAKKVFLFSFSTKRQTKTVKTEVFVQDF
jgi:hypothetical protein